MATSTVKRAAKRTSTKAPARANTKAGKSSAKKAARTKPAPRKSARSARKASRATRAHGSQRAFHDFDLREFWEPSAYASETYFGEPLSAKLLASVEAELGYTLPGAYVELMKRQNGGTPRKTNYRSKERTSWSEDHIAITGIFGIGRKKRCTLCGGHGSRFWIDEWGYPAIGVYFADCPSAGHDMVCLDYRTCGPGGEPEVVHVDQEPDFKVTFLAKNFESFILGLEDEDAFE